MGGGTKPVKENIFEEIFDTEEKAINFAAPKNENGNGKRLRGSLKEEWGDSRVAKWDGL